MKKLIFLSVLAWLILFATGFSWGGQDGANRNCKALSPCSMAMDNHINYYPRPAYNLDGQVMCVMLPFERYWSDDIPINGRLLTVAYSARCDWYFRWWIKVGVF